MITFESFTQNTANSPNKLGLNALFLRTFLQIADPLKQSLRCENKVHLLGHPQTKPVFYRLPLALFASWFMGSAPYTKSS